MPLGVERREFLSSSKESLVKSIKADALYDSLVDIGFIDEAKKKELKVNTNLRLFFTDVLLARCVVYHNE